MRRIGLLLMIAACGSGNRTPAPPPHDLDAHVQTPPRVTEPVVVDAVPPPPPPPTPPAAPAVPDATTIERLGWPKETASFQLKNSARVYAAPDVDAEPLGKIIIGTRLAIGESKDGNKRCKIFLAVAPQGWICSRYATPSTKAPEATALPIVPSGKLLPQDYYGIKEGAHRYATEQDVRADHPRPEPKAKSTYMITRDEDTIDIDGVEYAQTSVGLVEASELYKHTPSAFAGIDLVATPPPSWPFAWVYAGNKKTVTARATADKKGAVAGTFAHRDIVPVLEEVDGFVRVADGTWLERASVRIARKRPRPAVDDANARWIDLDLDEQVMVAYDGESPVFATLFSSGRRKKDTPAALYRIRSKSAVTKMTAEEREASHYEVSEVPWATRFRSGLYFHAAYWHDGFGTAKSHGCVNLSPRDAKWVYDWTVPTMPAGWNELEVAVAGSMVVLAHDAKNPDPKAFDYDKEAIERVKIRKQEKLLKKKREEAEAAAEAAAMDPALATPSSP